VTEQDQNKTEADSKPAENKSVQEPAKEKKHAANKPAHKPQTRHTARNLTLVLLIVVAAAVAAAYYGYQFLQQQAVRMDALTTQQSQLQDENAQLKTQLEESLQTLSKQQTDLAGDIETLRARNMHLHKDWLINEAEYLVQLANYRLLFERDIKTAVVALETADMRLRETGDPGLIGVRKAIADAIQALKAVPQADLAGLSLSMSAIAKEVNELPLSTPDPKSKIKEVKPELKETEKVTKWSELPAAIWHDLKGLVVIRHHDKPVEPLIAPDQRFFLTENLRLQIEQARLAMLSGHPDVYKERLTTASKWIAQYFDKDAAQTKTVLDTLKQLLDSKIAPPLPDISKPYQLLQDYRQQQNAAAANK